MLTDRQIDKIVDFLDDFTTDDIIVIEQDDGVVDIEFNVTPRRVCSPYFKHCNISLDGIEDVATELEKLVNTYGVYEHCKDILAVMDGKEIDIMQIINDLTEIQKNMFEIYQNVDELENELYNIDLGEER